MGKEVIVYFNGEVIDTKYSIAYTILKLELKKGDTFDYFPFNNFDDEDSPYREEIKDFHTKLIIKDIKYSFVDTWNSSIKTKIEIFLEKDMLSDINNSFDEDIINTLESILNSALFKVETFNESVLVKLMELRGTPVRYDETIRNIEKDFAVWLRDIKPQSFNL